MCEGNLISTSAYKKIKSIVKSSTTLVTIDDYMFAKAISIIGYEQALNLNNYIILNV